MSMVDMHETCVCGAVFELHAESLDAGPLAREWRRKHRHSDTPAVVEERAEVDVADDEPEPTPHRVGFGPVVSA